MGISEAEPSEPFRVAHTLQASKTLLDTIPWGYDYNSHSSMLSFPVTKPYRECKQNSRALWFLAHLSKPKTFSPQKEKLQKEIYIKSSTCTCEPQPPQSENLQKLLDLQMPQATSISLSPLWVHSLFTCSHTVVLL